MTAAIAMDQLIAQAAAVIRERAEGFVPKLGIILGSGLGPIADDVRDAKVISYADLPGFPAPGVAGHAGRLVLGMIGNTPVAVMQGRAHYYEHGQADIMKAPIRALQAAGCEALLLTNAAGSLRQDVQPGSVSAICDHISLAKSPLIGEKGNSRFVNMVDAYDPALRDRLQAAAKKAGVALPEGIYCWVSGPQFETPAEIRAFKILGADLVGMSTVPEVILARHAGLKVAALSIITNMAAGMSGETLSHSHTISTASQAFDSVRKLLIAFFEDYSA